MENRLNSYNFYFFFVLLTSLLTVSPSEKEGPFSKPPQSARHVQVADTLFSDSFETGELNPEYWVAAPGPNNGLVQAAISFCLAYDAVSTVIPGNTTIGQLESNLESIKYPMPKELVEKLEDFYQYEVKGLRLPW